MANRRSSVTHPGGGSAVVVDEERPSVGGYPHLPARRQEALLGLVLRLGWAVGRRLRGLRVGEGVFHCPPRLDVVGPLNEKKWQRARNNHQSQPSKINLLNTMKAEWMFFRRLEETTICSNRWACWMKSKNQSATQQEVCDYLQQQQQQNPFSPCSRRRGFLFRPNCANVIWLSQRVGNQVSPPPAGWKYQATVSKTSQKELIDIFK